MERGGALAPPRNRLPAPKTLGMLALAVLPFFALWMHGRMERSRIEGKAAAVASQIALRPVHVRCPGPFRRHFMYEITEGNVRFDADGAPLDYTSLSPRTCDGLKTMMAKGAGWTFDCLAYGCSKEKTQAAAALAVLAHESIHLRGVTDEGSTECQAHKYGGLVAQSYGLSPRAVQNFTHWQSTDWVEMLPERYRTC